MKEVTWEGAAESLIGKTGACRSLDNVCVMGTHQWLRLGEAHGRRSEGGLTVDSMAIGDVTPLLPDGCTFSSLIRAGRELRVFQAFPESRATTVHGDRANLERCRGRRKTSACGPGAHLS